MLDGGHRLGLLVVPVEFTAERDHSFLNLYRDAVGGQPDAPFEDVDGAPGDLFVRGFLVLGQAHLDLFGNGLHPLDPPDGALGRSLLGMARHKPGECDDAAADGNTDMGGIDGRLEFKFVEHVAPQLVIADH